MKIKTALKQSIVGARVAAVLSLGALAVAIVIPNATTIARLAFIVFFPDRRRREHHSHQT